VVMHDCHFKAGAEVSFAIVDKDVSVGVGSRVGRSDITSGSNIRFPSHLSGGITVIGKGSRLPDGIVVGANCLIGCGLSEERFEGHEVPDGESVLQEC